MGVRSFERMIAQNSGGRASRSLMAQDNDYVKHLE